MSIHPGGYSKTPSVFKGALCSNKQNRQFNHCLELSKDALIRILCCLLRVSTGSSVFILILSIFSLFPSEDHRQVLLYKLNSITAFIFH